MVQPNEHEELIAAWRALATTAGSAEGWRAIPLGVSGGRKVRAGRRFPGNEEALLVGFSGVRIPQTQQLPQGQGFLTTKVDLGTEGTVWLALSRQTGGNLDLFTMMTFDILAALAAAATASEEQVLQRFLTRIRAWQEFMRRGTDAVLGPQEETGLFGELIVLRTIIKAGTQPASAIDSWVGPVNGIQDFALGTGAVEVKASIATSGFPVTIECLDQLDDSLRQPLFLAAVRLRLDVSGMSLPAIVEDTRALLGEDSVASNEFNSKLLHGGYVDVASSQYARKFVHAGTRILQITDAFPRLIRAKLPPEIIDARYQFDCDQVQADSVDIDVVLGKLGVI